MDSSKARLTESGWNLGSVYNTACWAARGIVAAQTTPVRRIKGGSNRHIVSASLRLEKGATEYPLLTGSCRIVTAR